jgi:hypothetical protein
MNAWSHLPNAHHIDRVIESVKENLEIWVEAWDAFRDMASNAIWGAAVAAVRDAASDAAWGAASDAAWGAVRGAASDAARGAASDAARLAIWGAVRGAAWGPIAALIAYDDASKYLEMSSGHLRVWAILSEDPAAVLLLPAVVVFERISELE